ADPRAAPSQGQRIPRGACVNTLGHPAMVPAAHRYPHIPGPGKTADCVSRRMGPAGASSRQPRTILFLDACRVSTGVVALGEIGDKTQLLAMVLAARYHRPVLICLGVLIATLANHALAGLAGQLVARLLDPTVLQWLLGISFLLMAGWLLIPDKLDEAPAP